jgi:hypothetical protein
MLLETATKTIPLSGADKFDIPQQIQGAATFRLARERGE